MIRNELLELDAHNRDRAIAPESFIVEAPAGAGKTELLTQRYLRLLALVNEPEEIVAITFTNKAAAEMRSRILSSLQDAADGMPVDKPHKQRTRELALAALQRSQSRGWNLLAEPARLRINTIDSLSSLLARQMPLLSRFGAQPAVTDDAMALYREAASRAIALLESEAHAPVSIALQYFDNDVVRLTDQLAQMLTRRDQWLSHAAQQPAEDEVVSGLRHLIQQDITAAARVLNEGIQRRLMPIARFAASNLPCEHCVSLLLDWETPLLPTLESLPVWLSVCDLLLTKDGGLRKEGGLNAKNGLPANPDGKAHKQALVEIITLIEDADALARLRKLPDLRNIEEERRIVGALAQLLKIAAGFLFNVFQEAGEVDFVEVSQRAVFALEDSTGPTDLALKLDYRIQHLLVDEFQDTSPGQVQLLEKLTAGWEPGDGRTIFCVGDPMQSIYRFRKADVGLFLKVAQAGIGHLPLESLKLTRNNRSCPAVIDWVNGAFTRVFPRHDSVTQGAISYREFAATRDSTPDAGVFVHPVIGEAEADSETLAALEAHALADLIEQEQREDPTRSIAVLVRARSHLHALVTEIRRNRPEIRFQAVEVEALAERQSVQDMLALTRALLHRADRVNWLAVLRAPWCGLTLADMHALAADDHGATIWQLMHDEARIVTLSEDGQQRLRHVRTVFAESYAHHGRQSMRRWVESTWLRLGGPQCLWQPEDVRDVQALLDLIDQLDVAGRFDIAALEEGVAALYAAPDIHGTVQFMTIHKSKGLEFDSVILPGLHRASGKSDAPLLLWEEVTLEDAPPQLVAAPWRPKHRRDGMPSSYDYLQGLENERTANETARVLYVAVTRAVRRLHLVGALKHDHAGVKPPAGTLLELLWPSIGGEFLRAAEQQSPLILEAPAPSTFIPKLVRMAQPAEHAVFRQAVATSSGATNSTEAEADRQALHHPIEAGIGTLAHRYLELIAQQGSEGWTEQRLRGLLPAMQRWFAGQGQDEAQAKPAAQRVQELLVKVLASEQGRWLLQPRSDAAYELALTRADREALSRHVVDRTFVEDGVRWVVDYKSALLDNSLSDDDLQREAERHREQLERYAALFTRQGLPVKKAVFFLASARLIELV